jgi:phosphoglycerate dehydrogenase-like enzyme
MSGGSRRRVGLASSEYVRERFIDDADLARLAPFADFAYHPFTVASDLSGPAPRDAGAEAAFAAFAADLDVLVVCHGAPFVSAAVLAAAPRLTMLGELDGDRFGYRLDVAAAQASGVCVVDTTHGSSWPTAEWALGLALIGRRNAGEQFRRMIAHQPSIPHAQRWGPGYDGAELSDKRVGMVGFGYLARRLVELLRPFHVEITAFDPFAPRALAEPYDIAFGPLEAVLDADVVFVLVPHTPATERMIGAPQLELLRPGSVLVNVSRGKVIESDALVSRLARGDVIGCLDVFDPEPVPTDSPILDMPNVFVTPHIAGYTEESRRRFFSLMVDECLRHFAGLEPRAQLTVGSVRPSPVVAGS